MKTLQSVLQKRDENSGTMIGWSSMSAFHACELKWALSELLPHPKGGIGIDSGMSHALFVGSRIHDALRAWYHSDPTSVADHDGGPITRRYDSDAGMQALRRSCDETRDAVADDERWAEWKAESEQIWRRYAAECGPGGPDPETNYFVLAHDENGPLVEREFTVPLGYGDWFMSTRVDTIGWDIHNLPTTTHEGVIVIPEHKTSDVAMARGALLDYALSGQLSVETLAIKECLGWQGQTLPIINLIKKRAAGEKIPLAERGLKGGLCRLWEPQTRTDFDLAKFKHDMVRRLKRMTLLVEEWKEHIRKGMDPLDAIYLVFDGNPERQTCAGQGYQCFAYNLCLDKRVMRGSLLSTNPRFPANEPRTGVQTLLEGVA